MALRPAAARLLHSLSRPAATMERGALARGPRYFSDDKGRVLSEEERAKETVYIQKMEREKMEKLKKKAEAEKAKKAEEPQKG